ncbi:MAG: IS66 family insertion sequence element accessory protein TnpB, partial [Pseudomonadales bacterium]|nr:IS66 family insertion sequence element accessory protein TnpB [Pseudomonadales bacterium]
MLGQLADRLETLDGHTIAFLDCGKRGGAPILTGIEEQLAANHVFTNRRRNLLKMLFWEDNGFCLYYKRLEQHRFHWPLHMESSVITLT